MRTWAPVVDLLQGFTPMAADDWPVVCEDKWPAGRLRESAMLAYNALARKGEILPAGTHRYRSGVVVVMYRAKIPEAWVRELLAREERRITGR